MNIPDERESTHGNFMATACTAQRIKIAIEMGENWMVPDREMPPALKEALHMIATKMARIVEGDANEMDHWGDIMGYADLAMRSIKARAALETRLDD